MEESQAHSELLAASTNNDLLKVLQLLDQGTNPNAVDEVVMFMSYKTLIHFTLITLHL